MNFKSWKDYYEFRREVQHNNRYIYSDQVKRFLDNLKETLCERVVTIGKDKLLFRSQIGYDEFESEGETIINGLDKERMKPTSSYAYEGRANPKGILFLYLASNDKTSMAELRPHNGEIISCATFKVIRDLKIVDCYSKHDFNMVEYYFNPPKSPAKIMESVWGTINKAFADPIRNSDTASEYVPTQILAELFKSEGFDGICCKSGLGDGYNFILFDLDYAEAIAVITMQTETIDYKFKQFSQGLNYKGS